MQADRSAFTKVEQAVRLSRYGGDCYAYCMLAAGHIDLVIETELKPYDVMALIPIIAGAGGIVTTWEDGPPQNGGRIVAAGDKRVHAAGARNPQSADLKYQKIGVPGTKASNAAQNWPRNRSCSISISCCAPGRSRMRAGAQAHGEFLDRRVSRRPASRPAATISIGWRILHREATARQGAPSRGRLRRVQVTVGQPMPSAGSASGSRRCAHNAPDRRSECCRRTAGADDAVLPPGT